jgi:hypothetical protein
MVGLPAKEPHEYIRGGTAKLMSLFRPGSGELRALAVAKTPNGVLHPWLMGELEDILSATVDGEPKADDMWRDWASWMWPSERIEQYTSDPAPYVRMLLVLDNLSGHRTKSFVAWCLEQGVALLYTPLGGSWLNMAESVQRVIVHRAIAGQHYKNSEELMEALGSVACGWNANPTPFIWGGKRKERRRRASERRHALGGSGACSDRPLIPRGTRVPREAISNGN